jgi:hypothetical protein
MEALWALQWDPVQVVLISDGLRVKLPLLEPGAQPIFELPPLSWQNFWVYGAKTNKRYTYWHSPQARAMLPQHANVRIRAERIVQGAQPKAP